MFASGTGSMRGPRAKTPLLLLLLLLSTLTGTVSCQDEDAEPETEDEEALDTGTESQPDPEEPSDGEDPGIPTTVSDGASASSPSPKGEDPLPIESTLGPDFTSTAPPDEPGEEEKEDGLSFIIILIPVVLVVLIIGMIVCGIFINRRWNQKVRNQELRKEDPYLDGSSTEKVPMPMFEEDVPSVLELEMEELGQWMKKDGEPADDSKLA